MKDGLNFFRVFISSASLVQIKTSRPLVSGSAVHLMLNRGKKRVFRGNILCERMKMYLQQVLLLTQNDRFQDNRLT